MVDFFALLGAFWHAILGELADFHFSILGYDVDLLSVMVVFMIIGFVITIFWKGAKA